MGFLTPGWQKKARKLRTTVACIPESEIQDATSSESEHYEIARAIRRGTIDGAEALRRFDGIERQEPQLRIHEPAEIYGWSIRATIIRWRDQLHWLVHVERADRMVSAKDKAMLVKIMNELGCDDLARDQISTLAIEDLAHEGVPVVFLWPNADQLLDIHVKGKGESTQMRLVPRGSRPADGYEKLEHPVRRPA